MRRNYFFNIKKDENINIYIYLSISRLCLKEYVVILWTVCFKLGITVLKYNKIAHLSYGPQGERLKVIYFPSLLCCYLVLQKLQQPVSMPIKTFT